MSEEEGKQDLGQGVDKNVDGPTDPKELDSMKMTGDGAPGSHSAVFGLTPDGKKHDETDSTTTAPKPAHSGQGAKGGGSVPDSTEDSSNTGSGGVSGGGVSDQMHDPQVAEKGHGGSAVESTGGAGEKPGAGTGTEAGSQGTGEI